MVEVKKKDKETSESLYRRFSHSLQQSKVLPQARKLRYRAKKKTKRQRIDGAVYRMTMKKAVDKLKKLGKFDESKYKELKRKVLNK